MTRRTASCSCGQLRLTTNEPPLRVSMCHCLACQRRTGSAFASQARFDRAGVQIAGVSSTYVQLGDEGGRATFHFCPQCGATVHYQADDDPQIVAVPVGAFADPGFPAPAVSVYEARMHPWVGLPVGMDHMA